MVKDQPRWKRSVSGNPVNVAAVMEIASARIVETPDPDDVCFQPGPMRHSIVDAFAATSRRVWPRIAGDSLDSATPRPLRVTA